MKVEADGPQQGPCESAHRITVSLEGVKPLTITLPYPILARNIKATLHRKKGVVEIVAPKALYDLWPEDIIGGGLRWSEEQLETWTNEDMLRIHLREQFLGDHHLAPHVHGSYADAVTEIREIVCTIFEKTRQNDQLRFRVFDKISPTSPLWYIRPHLPIRTSPQGTPILFVSTYDYGLAARLKVEGKLNTFPAPAKKYFDIHCGTAEAAHFFRYILLVNSTKMQPSTKWQAENLPLGGTHPWMSSFLFLDTTLFNWKWRNTSEFLFPRQSFQSIEDLKTQITQTIRSCTIVHNDKRK